jgi:uncharacterized membrane protein
MLPSESVAKLLLSYTDNRRTNGPFTVFATLKMAVVMIRKPPLLPLPLLLTANRIL